MHRLLSILGRLAAFFPGCYIVFGIFLLISMVMARAIPPDFLHRFFLGTYVVFSVPIFSLRYDLILLSFAASAFMLPSAVFHAQIHDIASFLASLLGGLARDIGFFIAIGAAIFIFERVKEKKVRDIAAFYGLVLPVLWILFARILW